MKLFKKELEKIPLEPCPECDPAEAKLIMTASQAEIKGGTVLVSTFYTNNLKHAPYLRVYCSRDSYVAYRYGLKSWSNAKLENLPAEKDSWRSPLETTYTVPGASRTVGCEFFGYKPEVDTLKAISHFQDMVSEAHAAKLQQSNQRILEQILPKFPPLPDIEQEVMEGPLCYSRYIFYRSGKYRDPLTGTNQKTYFGYCSHCRVESVLDFTPQHKGDGTCPNCGAHATTMARRISRTSLRDSCNYLVFQKDRAGDVYAYHLEVVRNYSVKPEEIKTHYQEVARYYFGKSASYRFLPEYTYSFEPRLLRWRKAQKVLEPYNNLARCKYHIHPFPKGFFNGTSLCNAHLETYLKVTTSDRDRKYFVQEVGQSPIGYLSFYLKHPSVENLLLAGFKTLVKEVISTPNIRKQINWNKVRPRDLLGISQPEVVSLSKLNPGMSGIKTYKKLKDAGLRLEDKGDVSLLQTLLSSYWNMNHLEEIGLQKAVRYLRQQKRKCYGKDRSYSNVIQEWLDYRRQCARLNYNVEDPYYGYPSNLKKAHTTATERLNEIEKERQRQRKAQMLKEAREQEARYQKRFKILQELCYKADGLCIRPVASADELINEGKVLKHCVASYWGSVFSGETLIFFIRRTKKPDVPYYTLNLNPEGNFIQCHGYQNDRNLPGGERPQRIKDFEKRWMSEVVGPWFSRKQNLKRLKGAEEEEIKIMLAVGA